MSDVREELRCVSVHSVKGGVGKSTLALSVARRLAAEGPCLLVDMDLTGTSLADVLALEAPDLADSPECPPRGFLSVEDGRRLIDERSVEGEGGPGGRPLMLNDFLLYEQDRFDADLDLHPLAVAWREAGTGLLVAPSSALPHDLTRTLPVIYDELHAGFFEGRIEWLLNHLLQRTDIRTVVFDTPPSIPGLSAAVLSAAMRLPRRKHLAPTEPHTSPRRLFEATIRWAPLLVVSPDHQDLRSAERWLIDKPPEELATLRVVLNGAVEGDVRRLRHALYTWGTEADLPADFDLYDRPLLDETRLVVLPRTDGLLPFRPGRGGPSEPVNTDQLVEAVRDAWAHF